GCRCGSTALRRAECSRSDQTGAVTVRAPLGLSVATPWTVRAGRLVRMSRGIEQVWGQIVCDCSKVRQVPPRESCERGSPVTLRYRSAYPYRRYNGGWGPLAPTVHQDS